MALKVRKNKLVVVFSILSISLFPITALLYIHYDYKILHKNIYKKSVNEIKFSVTFGENEEIELIPDRNIITNHTEVEDEEISNNYKSEKIINNKKEEKITNNTKNKIIKDNITNREIKSNAKTEDLTISETSVNGSFDNVYCGIWQEQYTLFHRKMETSKKKKYLILDAYQCGWGDRLIQIISGFYVALLSKRSFKIIGIDLEQVFEKPNIDWTLDKKELERMEKNHSIKELYYTANKENYFDEGFLYTNFTSNYEDYEGLRYRIQNGKIVKIFENVFHKNQLYEMGLRPDTAFGCAYEYLFKPKKNVMDIISKYYEEMGIKRNYYMSQNNYISNSKISYLPPNDEPIRIGIQIRTGDDVFNNNESIYCKDDAIDSENIKQYFECAQSIENDILKNPYNKPSGSLSMQSEKKERKVYWFLITDCKILREKAKKLWPDKIITITDKPIDHLDKTKNDESINLTFGEHWLFGEMDYHIISRSSCYGRTASLRRKIFHHIYELEINQPRSSYNKCSVLNFDTFEDYSKYWIEL